MQSVVLPNQRNLQKTSNKAPRVGGSLSTRGVDWKRFLVKDYTNQLVSYISLEMIAWVIDLMLQFIQDVVLKNYVGFTDHSLQYVMRVTTHEFRQTEFTFLKGILNVNIPSVVLLTMKAGENEPSGIILVDGDQAEVFYPFPDSLSQDKTQQGKIDDVIAGIATKFNRKLNKRLFQFAPGFAQSNLWNIYYVMLRLRYKFDTVQQMFMDPTITHDKRNEKAFFCYFLIGQLISRCMKQAADNKVPVVTGDHGIYRMYFSKQNKAELRVDDKMRAELVKVFPVCKLKKEDLEWIGDLVAPRVGAVNAAWPKDIDKQWDNFVPVDNARAPEVNFAKE